MSGSLSDLTFILILACTFPFVQYTMGGGGGGFLIAPLHWCVFVILAAFGP